MVTSRSNKCGKSAVYTVLHLPKAVLVYNLCVHHLQEVYYGFYNLGDGVLVTGGAKLRGVVKPFKMLQSVSCSELVNGFEIKLLLLVERYMEDLMDKRKEAVIATR